MGVVEIGVGCKEALQCVGRQGGCRVSCIAYNGYKPAVGDNIVIVGRKESRVGGYGRDVGIETLVERLIGVEYRVEVVYNL